MRKILIRYKYQMFLFISVSRQTKGVTQNLRCFDFKNINHEKPKLSINKAAFNDHFYVFLFIYDHIKYILENKQQIT